MKAILKSTRIAPKKASLIAKMVRGKPVPEALSILERTNKKAARLLEELIRSAMANASQNDKQKPEEMIIKSLIVNKAQAYYRGYPMARGRQRVYRKFMSHITVHLGYPDEEGTPDQKGSEQEPKQTASQSDKKTVKKSTSTASRSKKVSEKKSATKTKKTNAKESSKKNSSSSSTTST